MGAIVDCPLQIETVSPSDREVFVLDYHIWIDIDRDCLFYALYDKKRSRPGFENLATFPDLNSHLHIDIKLGALSSQILRIARRSKRLRDFQYDATELISRMVRLNYPLPPL